jgi:bifunctional enzyme CysN/CysC
LAGEIANFTGVSAPYEVPRQADLVVDTGSLAAPQAAQMLVDYAERQFSVGAGTAVA